MKIDHIGIVVKNIGDSIEYWQKVFGYKQYTEVVTNKRQKVRVVFLKKNDSIEIKLVEPTDQTSSVYRVAMRGGGLHHLCFKCDNLNQQIDLMKGHGIRMLVPPEPGEAFENEKIAFMLAPNGLNMEMIDTEKRAKII